MREASTQQIAAPPTQDILINVNMCRALGPYSITSIAPNLLCGRSRFNHYNA
jgi:hypothetical protein